MSLSTDLPAFSHEVADTLSAFFDQQEQLAVSVDPILTASLSQLRAFSLRGGKAIRPFLAKLSFELANGKTTGNLTKAVSALDLHHKHILILDDIADRDEERYGGKTLEWAYRDVFDNNENGHHWARSFAMLDSVWLGSLARELLIESGFESDKLVTCCHILNTLMYRDTLAGWQIHALECTKPIRDVTPQEFTKGLELVTARYTFEGPFMIGLTLAGNTDMKLKTALVAYSKAVGTAFQIHDDILGLFGDSDTTGKPVGNDIREGKKTLLVQIAYERSNQGDKDILETAVGNKLITASHIQTVKRIIETTGALEYSKDLERKMVAEGIEALAHVPDSDQKQTLVELASYVISRDK